MLSNLLKRSSGLLNASKFLFVPAARTISWMASRNAFGNLDDMQIALRESVEKFAQTELLPIAEKVDEEMHFPDELWKKMGDLGLHGITVPEKYGGAGLGYLEHCIVMEELSRANASVALSYGAHSNICINQIKLNGSEAQKMNYLPKLISGEMVGALAMSETESGSDVTSMRTKAELLPDGNYKINGHKMWITNGPSADLIIVYAKTDPAKQHKGITSFLVETTTPGFSASPKLSKLGMRGSKTCQIHFDDMIVPASQIMGKLNEGVKVLMSGLDFERLILTAGPIGIMQACMDTVLPYIRQRKQFGQPIGEFELMQGKIADMYTSLSMCRCYLYSVARAADNGFVSRQDCAGAILRCAETATQVSLDAIQCLGGNGYINEYPTGRYLRDAKLYEIGAGTSEIRRFLIGRELFNSPDV